MRDLEQAKEHLLQARELLTEHGAIVYYIDEALGELNSEIVEFP